MGIFDYLSVSDLIMIAESNPRFADIILNHYIITKLRCHEKRMTLAIGGTRIKLSYRNDGGNEAYLTHNANETIIVLKLFGHIITDLDFDLNHFGSSNLLEFIQYGERYCPQAAKAIYIRHVNQSAIANWTYSFDHTATKVTNYGNFPNSARLNDFFPFMQELTVWDGLTAQPQHYPYLTKFSTYAVSHGSHASPNIRELLRLNPQLQHFYSEMRVDAAYVEYLSYILPNLESLSIDLEIQSQDTNLENIHFKRVKDFSLVISISGALNSYRHLIGNITFDQLDTLQLKSIVNAPATPIFRIFSQNRNLKKIVTNMISTTVDAMDVLEMWPELKEITFSFLDDAADDALEAVLLANHGLEKINVSIFSPHRRLFNERFGNNTPAPWKLVKNEKIENGFTFIRMN